MESFGLHESRSESPKPTARDTRCHFYCRRVSALVWDSALTCDNGAGSLPEQVPGVRRVGAAKSRNLNMPSCAQKKNKIKNKTNASTKHTHTCSPYMSARRTMITFIKIVYMALGFCKVMRSLSRSCSNCLATVRFKLLKKPS